MTFDTAPFNHFDEASRAVLQHLQDEAPMGLWMVTRTAGDDWIVLTAEDRAYAVSDGTVLRWSDSFCSRMVHGDGPRVAPRAADVPAYASAPIAAAMPIGSYIGVPLVGSDGELFGTLCAIDPQPRGDGLADVQQTAELMARLLGSVLAADRVAVEQARRAERARQEAVTDHLTGLANRRGWDEAVDREEARSRRFGDPVAVIVADLDGLKAVNDRDGHDAGDALIATAARTFASAVGDRGLAARLGGDEFAALLVSVDALELDELAGLVRSRMEERGIAVSVGVALQPGGGSIRDTVVRADRAMFEHKRARAAG